MVRTRSRVRIPLSAPVECLDTQIAFGAFFFFKSQFLASELTFFSRCSTNKPHWKAVFRAFPLRLFYFFKRIIERFAVYLPFIVQFSFIFNHFTTLYFALNYKNIKAIHFIHFTECIACFYFRISSSRQALFLFVFRSASKVFAASFSACSTA